MGDIQLPEGATLTPEIIEGLLESLDSIEDEIVWAARTAPEYSAAWNAVLGCIAAVESASMDLKEMLDNLKKKGGA